MASASSSSQPSASSAALPKDAPLPSDSEIWSFGCQCLNVSIDGRRMTRDPSFGEGKARVWIGEDAERAKQAAYVSYDQNPIRRGSVSSPRTDGDTLGPSWRTCWICETKLYLVSGKARGDPGVQNAWVEVEPSKVLHGKALEKAADLPSLPFSGLHVPLPSTSSTFGRPPVDPAPSIYSPVSTSPAQTPRPRTSLIPPVHDPFFLPPPFIPAHPHLRDLCNSAVTHLVERHTELENEVKQYISDKAREMRELEEKVRAEVELLWEKYKIGPGAGEEFERKRRPSTGGRASMSASVVLEKPSPSSPPPMPTNPILREAALQSPGQGSLLSASISANQMFAPPPPPVADAVDDSISEAAKTYGKKQDQRAVAMSYVFSALDETMANQARTSVRKTRRRSAASEEREAASGEGAGAGSGAHGKDSWIEQERITAANVLSAQASEEEEMMEGTPRPALTKELERRGSKGKEKEKARVTFEEPIPEEPKPMPTPPVPSEDEDYVFDFELDNGAKPQDGEEYPEGQMRKSDISRSRNIVEANLSTTFAADAPSHRAAWRRMGEKSPLYAAIRRRDPSDDDSTDDGEQVSKLATSVPVSIALPARRVVSGFNLEPKTSLSDRTGIMVPPLKAAMREQGVGRQGRASISAAAGSPAGRRSASVSRERDAARSFRADPGAVFESLADDDDDDDEEDGIEEDGGTLRESKTFMPPHILARKESRETGDVGWRSMVDQ